MIPGNPLATIGTMSRGEATGHRDAPGRLVAGRYRLRAVLGTGGMATVHRADDEFLGRTVALKLFHADLANARNESRQREEVSLLASLNHPALVTLLDAGRDADDAFLVMEYVEGTDLRQLLLGAPLTPARGARIGTDIATALAHIHARDVVHRDVKPANILVPAGAGSPGVPSAKLADFGIARLIDSTRLTATGTLVGTASFLSPEQARGAEVGTASDIYSLGLVILESITGERAFPGTPAESTIARLSRDPVVPEFLGLEWGSLLRSATARNPQDRPTARELAAALSGIAADGVHGVIVDTARGDTATVALDDTVPQEAADVPTEAMLEGESATAVLPASATATEVIGRPPAVAKAAASTAPAVASGARRRRTPLLVGGAVLVGVVAATIAIAGQLPTQNATVSTGTVDYPAVEGDLGAHLASLQESVAP